MADKGKSGSYFYDAPDRPFDLAIRMTALVCEAALSVREKISKALKDMEYQVTESFSAADAIKNMQFCAYDVVVLNERFDTLNPDENEILKYLNSLLMYTRRKMFVVLISGQLRTMDNMASLHRGVNLVINGKNIDDIGEIIKRGMDDNFAFYRTFREGLQKVGKA
jgi:DNA-binding NtrC family response regulator